MRALLVALMAVSLAWAHSAWAAKASGSTTEVFRQIENRIAIVEIRDQQSDSKSALGSGFFVDAQGHVATNYHVVSGYVAHPERTEIRLRLHGDQVVPARLLNVDVVHDLAILDTGLKTTPLKLASQLPDQGDRLLALGSPLDLGFTIVEGTYNGFVQHALYKKIHFSGAINSGMSGGPTVNTQGEVVGINVASAGNGVGFIVPVEFLAALLQSPVLPAQASRAQIFARMEQQILAQQASLTQRVLQSPRQNVRMGPFVLPGQLAEFVSCWGNTETKPGAKLHSSQYQCEPESDIFLDEEFTTGTINYAHQWLDGTELNLVQFNHVLESRFLLNLDDVDNEQHHLMTPFRCDTRFAQINAMKMKTILCVRQYRPMPKLFDAVLVSTSLNDSHRAVLTRLRMEGISRASMHQLLQHFMGAYAWKP